MLLGIFVPTVIGYNLWFSYYCDGPLSTTTWKIATMLTDAQEFHPFKANRKSIEYHSHELESSVVFTYAFQKAEGEAALERLKIIIDESGFTPVLGHVIFNNARYEREGALTPITWEVERSHEGLILTFRKPMNLRMAAS